MAQTNDISYLENRLENNPDSVLFARLADRYIDLGRLDEAANLCRRGLERHPKYASAYIVLAKALWKKGELEDAETAVSKALELEPHNLHALRLRAEILRATGWVSNAVQDYRTLSILDPLAEDVRRQLEALKTEETEVVTPSEEERQPTPEEELVVAQSEETPPEPEEQTEQVGEEVEKVVDEIFESEELEALPETGQGTLEEAVSEELGEKSAEEEIREIFEIEEEKPEETAETAASLETEPEAEPETKPEPEAPQPEAAAEEKPKETPSPGSRPSIVTPTLGEIYAAQGQYAKAIGVFQVLKEKEPDNPEWDRKIEMLKQKLAEAESEKQKGEGEGKE